MAGMCRHTGRRLSGWDHIVQSLDALVKMRRKTRIEERDDGTDIPDLQDRPSDADTLLDYCVSLATAIDKYEPRVELTGIETAHFDENGHAEISLNLVEVKTGQQRIYGAVI
ncbi:hypothetical protein SAMN04488527_101254 [Aliiroseovarius crassostreae]|nr:GPW/gp25 family protein [Aliiroseovarius crassostreae]SFU31006.1 hypothetical protein SAMN04488527_101254 [Aliiroseovarius crassostreae]